MKLNSLLFVSLHVLEVLSFQESSDNYKYKFNFNSAISEEEAQSKLASSGINSNISYEIVNRKRRSQYQNDDISGDQQQTATNNFWLCEFPNMKVEKLSKVKKMKKRDILEMKLNAIGKINESIEAMENPILRRLNSKGELVYKNNQQITGKCLYHHTSYWTYEICYDGEIEQFHVLENQKTHELIVDRTVDTFLLGDFNGEEASKLEIAFADKTGNHQLVDPENEKMSDDLSEIGFDASLINRWSIVQTLSNGQNCDLTNRPRNITFIYSCFSFENADLFSYLGKKIQKLVKEAHVLQSKSLSDTLDNSNQDSQKFFSKISSQIEQVNKKETEPTLVDIKELTTCNYEILVHFPKLCKVPEFISKSSYARESLDSAMSIQNSKEVSIECVAIESENHKSDKRNNNDDNNNNNDYISNLDGDAQGKSIDNFHVDIEEYKFSDMGAGYFYGISEQNIENLGKINVKSENFELMEFKPDILIFNDFEVTKENLEKLDLFGNFLGFATINILEFTSNLNESKIDPFYLFTTERLLSDSKNEGGHYCLKIYNKLGEYVSTFIFNSKAGKIWYEVTNNVDCEKNYYSEEEYQVLDIFKDTFDFSQQKGSKVDKGDNFSFEDDSTIIIEEKGQTVDDEDQMVIETTITNTVTQTSLVRDEL